MALYNYAKYKVNSSTTYSEGTWGSKTEDSVSQLRVGLTVNKFRDGYSWNGTEYEGTGSIYNGVTENKYFVSSDGRFVNQALAPTFTTGTGEYYSSKTLTRKSNTTYSRGAFIETVVAEDGAYPNNARHTDGFWYSRLGLANATPTVTLETPVQNQTLYENDVLSIAGSATETDLGNSVTIRYQINAETARAIKAFVANGNIEAFTKQLTFKDGSLYDGEILIAANLTDGVGHVLKVWATDDVGGQSSIIEQTFYVVPNRAPILNVNPPTTEGNTDADKITISGDFNEPDGNQAVVKYRINGSNSVQIAEGTTGNFEFDVSFAQLQIGVNNIVIEVTDTHNAKTSRTVKLNKTATETPILKSTARYKVQPPQGVAKAVLLWVTRDADLQIEASLSMTMQGEQESFVPVAASNSAPSPDFANAIEDEFYVEADDAKDNIILQLDMTRASIDVNPKVYIIQGVLE